MRPFLALYILCAFVISFAEQSISVEKYGRRIQLDGFLLEWNAQTAKPWKNNNQTWFIDAVNTEEGLAGYFRSDSSVSCSSWFFTFSQPSVKQIFKIQFPNSGNEFYKSDPKLYDSLGIITIEWVIPWKQISYDSTGKYSLFITGNSNCGDSLPQFQISGFKDEKTVVNLISVIFRAGLIILLIVTYLILNAKIHNRKQRKKQAQ